LLSRIQVTPLDGEPAPIVEITPPPLILYPIVAIRCLDHGQRRGEMGLGLICSSCLQMDGADVGVVRRHRGLQVGAGIRVAQVLEQIARP
jgi:hypothetical protein